MSKGLGYLQSDIKTCLQDGRVWTVGEISSVAGPSIDPRHLRRAFKTLYQRGEDVLTIKEGQLAVKARRVTRRPVLSSSKGPVLSSVYPEPAEGSKGPVQAVQRTPRLMPVQAPTSRTAVTIPDPPRPLVQPYSPPHPMASKQAAQARRGQPVSPVVLPGSGVEIIPASATGGFDRPK